MAEGPTGQLAHPWFWDSLGPLGCTRGPCGPRINPFFQVSRLCLASSLEESPYYTHDIKVGRHLLTQFRSEVEIV